MKKPVRSRRFGDLFRRADSPLARLQEHATRLGQLQRHLDLLLPDYLKSQVAVANYQDGTLVLQANSAAVAAKLKLLLPRVKDGFWAQGVAVGDLRVKLRPPRIEPAKRQLPQRTVTEETVASLEHLQQALDADSPLATHLASLLGRIARRR